MKNFKGNFSLMFIASLMFFGLGIQANAQNNLTGTYQLDASRSDNVREIAQEAIDGSNVQIVMNLCRIYNKNSNRRKI